MFPHKNNMQMGVAYEVIFAWCHMRHEKELAPSGMGFMSKALILDPDELSHTSCSSESFNSGNTKNLRLKYM